jgi:hypothetical protein
MRASHRPQVYSYVSHARRTALRLAILNPCSIHGDEKQSNNSSMINKMMQPSLTYWETKASLLSLKTCLMVVMCVVTQLAAFERSRLFAPQMVTYPTLTSSNCAKMIKMVDDACRPNLWTVNSSHFTEQHQSIPPDVLERSDFGEVPQKTLDLGPWSIKSVLFGDISGCERCLNSSRIDITVAVTR